MTSKKLALLSSLTQMGVYLGTTSTLGPAAAREGIGKEGFACNWLPANLPRGVLIEISGPVGGGRTELVLQILAQNPTVRATWLESDFNFYPCALTERGISPDRILFIDHSHATRPTHWMIHQVLRSGLFQIVILSQLSTQTRFDETTLRRLQIEAQRSRASIILMTSQPQSASSWPIAVRLRVSRRADSEAQPQIEILKFRGYA